MSKQNRKNRNRDRKAKTFRNITKVELVDGLILVVEQGKPRLEATVDGSDDRTEVPWELAKEFVSNRIRSQEIRDRALAVMDEAESIGILIGSILRRPETAKRAVKAIRDNGNPDAAPKTKEAPKPKAEAKPDAPKAQKAPAKTEAKRESAANPTPAKKPKMDKLETTAPPKNGQPSAKLGDVFGSALAKVKTVEPPRVPSAEESTEEAVERLVEAIGLDGNDGESLH